MGQYQSKTTDIEIKTKKSREELVKQTKKKERERVRKEVETFKRETEEDVKQFNHYIKLYNLQNNFKVKNKAILIDLSNKIKEQESLLKDLKEKDYQTIKLIKDQQNKNNCFKESLRNTNKIIIMLLVIIIVLNSVYFKKIRN